MEFESFACTREDAVETGFKPTSACTVQVMLLLCWQIESNKRRAFFFIYKAKGRNSTSMSIGERQTAQCGNGDDDDDMKGRPLGVQLGQLISFFSYLLFYCFIRGKKKTAIPKLILEWIWFFFSKLYINDTHMICPRSWHWSRAPQRRVSHSTVNRDRWNRVTLEPTTCSA